MRKALIGLILAATATVPAAAWAQDWHHEGGRHNDGGQRQQQAPRQAQQAPQQGQNYVRQRGGDNGARGNWQGRNESVNRGNWQGRTENFDRNNYQNRNQQNYYQNRGGANYQGNQNRGNWQGGNRNNQSIYPQAWQGNPNDPRLRHYQDLERRNQQNYGGRGSWQGRNDPGKWRDGDRGGRGRTSWNRGWRNDNRYDWRDWRNHNRNIFHVGPYYSPYRGYGYNRFSIGVFLDPFFYDQRYWIGDPWEYRLPPAEPGTEWVRYYNDVLLVDVETGEVLDTIYDFFW